MPIRLPELQKVLHAIIDDKIMAKFETVKAGPECQLP